MIMYEKYFIYLEVNFFIFLLLLKKYFILFFSNFFFFHNFRVILFYYLFFFLLEIFWDFHIIIIIPYSILVPLQLFQKKKKKLG